MVSRAPAPDSAVFFSSTSNKAVNRTPKKQAFLVPYAALRRRLLQRYKSMAGEFVNIRSAVLEDKIGIERLAQVLTPATHGDHQSGNSLSLLLNSSDHRIWVAGSDETIFGWLHAYLAIRVGVLPFIEIGGLIVDEQYRRKGAGCKLVAEALSWGKTTGLAVRVRSNSKRDATHKFYQALGFKLLKQQHVFEHNL